MYPIFIGVIALPVFYFSFRYLILKYDVKTPGRKDKEIEQIQIKDSKTKWLKKSKIIIDSLGGKNNIVQITSCATRLRVKVKNSAKIDVKLAQSAGAIAVTKPSKTSVQVVIGPNVQFYMNEISQLLKK